MSARGDHPRLGRVLAVLALVLAAGGCGGPIRGDGPMTIGVDGRDYLVTCGPVRTELLSDSVEVDHTRHWGADLGADARAIRGVSTSDAVAIDFRERICGVGGSIWIAATARGLDPARQDELLDRVIDDELVPFVSGAHPGLRISPPYIPRTVEEGDDRVMHVTFPDGSSAELVYREELELAQRGVAPRADMPVPDSHNGIYPIDFQVPVAPDLAGWNETASVVPVFTGKTRWSDPTHPKGGRWHPHFTYTLPRWTFGVVFPAELTQEQAMAGFDVHEATDGFPVLEWTTPIPAPQGLGLSSGPRAISVRPRSGTARSGSIWPLGVAARSRRPRAEPPLGPAWEIRRPVWR